MVAWEAKQRSFSLSPESLTLPAEKMGANVEVVPGGPNDRSEAIYCLEPIENGTRSVGYGVIGLGFGHGMTETRP